MALDYRTRSLIRQLAASGRKPIHECTVDEARALSGAMAELAGPACPMGRVEDHTVSVPGGTIGVRVLVPRQGARGVILYLHGGGFVIGDIDHYDVMARKLAERTSCAVVLANYRKAPEHCYPIPVDDCDAALEWTAAHLDEIAGRPGTPLIIAGDSAGGNLAAVVARRARDRGGPTIALQVLIYPVTDASLDTPCYQDPENQVLLTRSSMVWFWDHYVPETSRRAEPDASPLRADDLSGLPPAVILTAEHDVLRDEGEAYAARLADAGVPVDLQRHEGQIHGFFSMLMLPGSERGFQQVVKAIQGCLARSAKAPATP